jgi:hypothetical protein
VGVSKGSIPKVINEANQSCTPATDNTLLDKLRTLIYAACSPNILYGRSAANAVFPKYAINDLAAIERAGC